MTDALPLEAPEDRPSVLPRLDSLDLLRGGAILGILLMNTQSMSMPSSAYMNPADYGDLEGANWYTWVTIHILADMKFITIFSMLFGAGILLQEERLAERGARPWRIHYRRMIILLGFGLIHAYFFWSGDILVTYALCGMLLYPIRRLPIGLLVPLAIGFISMATVAQAVRVYEFGYFGQFNPLLKLHRLNEQILGPYWELPNELAAYQGGWMDQMRVRSRQSFQSQTTSLLLWGLWRCGGAILLGMALQRTRFFHGDWGRPAYLFLACFAAPIGWIVTGLGVVYNTSYEWDWDYLYFMGEQFNYWGSLVTALGYSSFGVWLSILFRERRHRLLRAASQPLHAVGRTALSNYLLQTLIVTTIFYTLHRFGTYSRLDLLKLTIAVWSIQLILSPLYLRIFRQGPFEALWRRLTYGRSTTA